MSSFLHSAIVAVFLLLSQTIAFGDDAKPPATSPELAAADQLYRAGKFAEAEAGYQGVLKNDSKLVPAQSVAAQGVRDVEVRIWAVSFFVALVLKYVLL
jgi:hypothetical protein